MTNQVFKGESGCEVEVILDSISWENIRLLTVRLRYWRPIHSELMTHRVFSRNARSSRAVPVVTLLQEPMYIPHFMQNRPGMQALEELEEAARLEAEGVWREMAEETRKGVQRLHELGVHKQWANRPLEWFGWIDVLVTSTDWDNWFALRNHPAAAPEIHDLAYQMDKAFQDSNPSTLGYGDWHLPYITTADSGSTEELKVLSAARCARISYKPFDGEADYDKEKARYDKLVADSPVHASPTEHQAEPDTMISVELGKGQRVKVWANAQRQGNFVGWCQARKDILHEAMHDAHYYTH